MTTTATQPETAATRKLTGKTALVTGGARGIGAAIARELAAQGANVAISYVASADKANALVSEMEAQGVQAVAFKADQASIDDVQNLVESVKKHFGKLDILVNNAGVFVGGAIDGEADEVALSRQWAVNVHGVAAAVRAASRHMQEGGRIVNIGSVLGEKTPFTGVADYSATKAAVAAYTRGWARDLGPRGITVNAIQPGPINTDMNPEDGAMAALVQPMLALGRYGRPEEIAAVVAFLASPEASYITGVTLNVDGGSNA